jgi:serine/threonine-protein kinase/endoribonuclease IRE1
MGLAKVFEAGRGSFSFERRAGKESANSSGRSAGTVGWMAPELLVSHIARPSLRVDIFALGCLIYWMLSDGEHPFGDPLDRERMIVKGRPKKLEASDLRYTDAVAYQLISTMISADPLDRPSLEEVLRHPFFWPDDVRLQFLRDASDRFEPEPATAPIVAALEARAEEVLRLSEDAPVWDPEGHAAAEQDSDVAAPMSWRDVARRPGAAASAAADVPTPTGWMRMLHPEFVDELQSQRFRKYKTHIIRDLLRVMRNKAAHFRDLPDNVQELVGPVPSGFLAYFLRQFPLLLAHTFGVIQLHAAQDENLVKYFSGEG